MVSQTTTRQQDVVGGPDWSEDNTSSFEYDSLPDSTDFSSGYEPLISEDLDLYNATYVL